MADKTSVYNLSSQVLLLLTRIDKDLQIDRREVMDALRQGAMKFMKQDYFETLKNGQRFIDPHYVAKFKNIPILKDSTRFDKNYVELPTQYVSLKNNEGVQRVWPVTEEEEDYIEMIPVPDGAEEVYRNLTVNDALIGVWTYSLQRDRLYFGKKNGNTLLEEEISNVDIDIVVISPVDVGDEDPFPLPVEYHFDLIVSVLEVFSPNQERVRDIITQEVVNQLRAEHESLIKEFPNA
jgi:hypothetical protein